MTKKAEKTEVVEVSGQAVNLLTVIERAAMNKDTDIDKMNSLLELQKGIMEKQAEIDFTEAMARLQPELPVIKKTAKAHNTKYAKYEDVDRAIRPLYTQEGFATKWNTRRLENGETEYIGICSHKGGHSEIYTITLPDDNSGSKNAVQAKASTLSYAKRYLLQMMFNVVCVDEDDDGGSFQTIDNTIAVRLDQRIRALKDAETYKPKFLKYMKVDSVDKIKATDLQKAIIALDQKEGAKNATA